MKNINKNTIADGIRGNYDQFIISNGKSLCISGIPKDEIICPHTKEFGCTDSDRKGALSYPKWFDCDKNNIVQKWCYVNPRIYADNNKIVSRASDSALIGFTKGQWRNRLKSLFEDADSSPFVLNEYIDYLKTHLEIKLKKTVRNYGG
jgi:hypothetical protein